MLAQSVGEDMQRVVCLASQHKLYGRRQWSGGADGFTVPTKPWVIRAQWTRGLRSSSCPRGYPAHARRLAALPSAL